MPELLSSGRSRLPAEGPGHGVGQFVEAVRRVASEERSWIPRWFATASSAGKRRRHAQADPREREVLALWPRVGRMRIAAALVVSEKAVSKHIANIFLKLDLPPSTTTTVA